MTISRREFVAATAGTLMGPSVRQRRTLQARMPPEDGYKLWLRYAPPLPARLAAYRSATRQLIVEGTSATARVSREEILNAVASMLGTTPSTSSALHDGMVLVGTPTSSPLIRRLGWQTSLDAAGAEGFVIRSTRISNRAAIVIASIGETGALYGAFHFLRLLQTAQPIERLDVTERPKVQLRMLNHWDNLDGTIERGYAGRSLWQWDELPGTRAPRYTDYARVNA